MNTIRIGIVGLGANCRLRHVPGLLECENVEITGVVNRSAKSTAAIAKEFGVLNKLFSAVPSASNPNHV